MWRIRVDDHFVANARLGQGVQDLVKLAGLERLIIGVGQNRTGVPSLAIRGVSVRSGSTWPRPVPTPVRLEPGEPETRCVRADLPVIMPYGHGPAA